MRHTVLRVKVFLVHSLDMSAVIVVADVEGIVG